MGTDVDPERHMTRRLAPAVAPRSRTDGPSGRLQPVQRTIVPVGGSGPDQDAGRRPHNHRARVTAHGPEGVSRRP